MPGIAQFLSVLRSPQFYWVLGVFKTGREILPVLLPPKFPMLGPNLGPNLGPRLLGKLTLTRRPEILNPLLAGSGVRPHRAGRDRIRAHQSLRHSTPRRGRDQPTIFGSQDG